jgi:aspartyl-tRNA(Asn)/glutamyl-tRNA(Gln) amidotransferase subunit A
MALAWTHDKIGPMGHSAHDCGVILSALAGTDPDDPSSSDRPFRYPPADEPGRPYRLAVLKGGVRNAQPEVRKNFERALEEFEKLGTIEEAELPDLPFGDVASTIINAEGSAAFEEMFDTGSVLELTAPEDRVGGFGDTAILATEYLRALRIRVRLAKALDAFLAPFDAVLTVPTAGAATPADGSHSGAYGSRSMGGPGNVCGTPALVMPTGLTDDGLPTAIQLDGRAWSEGRLLALGLAFQQATGWHRLHPEVS